MSAHTSHTYLKTRASVMAKKLFSAEQVEQLLQSPLERLGDEFGLPGITDRDLSPAAVNRAVERALIHTLMLELEVLLRPLEGSARAILVHWSRKFELYNLKTLIRGKLKQLSFEQIKPYLYVLPELLSLPHDRLLRTESIQELLRTLERSAFAGIALQARRVYEEKNEPFSLDAAIDRSYYTGMLRRIHQLEPVDRAALQRLVGTLIDQQNLIWLLRYRFSYQLSPTESYYLLIPFGRRLHRERLMQLVNMERFEQVIEALPEGLQSGMASVRDLLGAERQLELESAVQARDCLRFSQSAVTRALAYLVLREMDLKKLYALVQGKALKLDETLIRTAIGNIRPGADQHWEEREQNV